MKLPWFWITGIAATTIGAISIGLITPHTASSQEKTIPPKVFFEEDPWDVFIRTDGRNITEQIEQLGMEIEHLERSLAQVSSRVPGSFSDSAEMEGFRRRLNSMGSEQRRMVERRHRMWLRWNLKGIGQYPSDEGTLPEPETVPLESRLDGDTLEQYRPPIQKLIEIQDEVIRKEVAEQALFQRLFGQIVDESQMARYTFIYRYFEAQGVRNQNALLHLTRCYSSFIIEGDWFDVNPRMAPEVRRICRIPPNVQALKGIQKTIAEDVQGEKAFLGRRFDMEVSRYSKMRQSMICNYAKSTGATDEQARVLIIKLKDFINNGVLPHNE